MRTFYGPVKEQYDNVLDAGKVDMVYMYPLVVVIIFIGIYPAILTDVIQIGLPALFS